MTETLIQPTEQTVEPVAAVEAVVQEQKPTHVLTDFLHDDLKARPAATKFTDVNELFKAYDNLEQLMGKKISNLSPDEIKYLDEKRGVPADAAEYKLPDGLDEATTSHFRELFKKAGLTKNAALEIIDGYKTFEQSKAEAMAKEFQALDAGYINALRQEFGADFEKRVGLANRALSEFGDNEAIQALVDRGLGNHPAIIKLLSNVGVKMLEDSIPSSRHGEAFGVSREDAKQQIEMLMADPATRDAYYNSYDPKHNIIKRQISELYAKAYD